ncbi:hypothetical protein WICPIJ_003668 [Wickerhamomyces pijperi]|uniref:Uncharacterized protein n=1 Tax=Wickerhamomyces pijperi TaxID=599730 RepID=A0A9P8TMU2_WICPI|nr:hypothetical protein WICPIJ_003668 [Wickerhamomyces pijperi]
MISTQLQTERQTSFPTLPFDILWRIFNTCLTKHQQNLLISKLPVLQKHFTVKRSGEIEDIDIINQRPELTILFQYEGFDYENSMPDYLQKRMELVHGDYLIVEIPTELPQFSYKSQHNLNNDIANLRKRTKRIIPLIKQHIQRYPKCTVKLDIAIDIHHNDLYRSIDFYPLIRDFLQDINHSINILKTTTEYHELTKSLNQQHSIFDVIDEIQTPTEQQFKRDPNAYESVIRFKTPEFKVKGQAHEIRSSTFFQTTGAKLRHQILDKYSSLKSINVICPYLFLIFGHSPVSSTKFLEDMSDKEISNSRHANMLYLKNANDSLSERHQKFKFDDIEVLMNSIYDQSKRTTEKSSPIDSHFTTSRPKDHLQGTDELQAMINYEARYRYHSTDDTNIRDLDVPLSRITKTMRTYRAGLTYACRNASISEHLYNTYRYNLDNPYEKLTELETNHLKLFRLELLSRPDDERQ